MTKLYPSQRPNQIVLVTGGAGYIGHILITTLIKKGYTLRVIDIKPLVRPVSGDKRVNYIQADIRKLPRNIFNGVSSIIHLAALSDEKTADRYGEEAEEINTQATIHLAKEAKKAGVSRFIFASSSSIYDRGIARERGPQGEDARVAPSGRYSISKYKAEKLLLTLSDDNFTVVIFRKATVGGFSPSMRFDLVVNAMVRSAIESGVIKVFCKGVQWRPLIDIHDVARAYCQALTASPAKIKGQIFNIGYTNMKVADIAILIQKTVRKHFSLNPSIVFEQDDKEDRSYRIITDSAKKPLKFTARVSIEKTIVDLYRNLHKATKSAV